MGPPRSPFPPERASRLRREPPPFRRVNVVSSERRSPRLVRLTLGGAELDGLRVDEPAASVRLVFPPPGADLEVPTWRGNEFLNADGTRPLIRTLTPRRFEPAERVLDVEIVVHDHAPMSQWATTAQPGAPAAVSGTARGYTIDADATRFVLIGDETAQPAISQLLEALPTQARVEVHIEVADEHAEVALPGHPNAEVHWHLLATGATPGTTMLEAVHDAAIDEGTRIWAAGEAAGVQRIRKLLFDERDVTRARATIRGYWKHGRAGDGEDR